jgi:glycosyltransferase involved in cell wall biosynthesis
MKLIYIVNARIPTEKAHGIQIMQMCAAFSSHNVEVELILPKRFNPIKEDPFEYYGIERNFKIKKLPCLDLIILDKYIGHLGLWIEAISFSISAFFYLLFTSNLKHQTSNLIYTRDKFFLPLVLFKKNLIFEAHAFPNNYFLYSPFLKKLKGIIVITQKLKDLFVKKGIAENKILVAPDAVDLEKFDIKETQVECRKKLNLPLDKKIVLYTGHLYGWKGATVLLKAARNFQFPISNFQFIFVGGTEKDIKDFRQKAQNLNNVMIVGHRPHSEIPYWLKAADVLVLPNSGKEEISKHWTSPIKMFEYMASKRPIVASDLPSIREILNEGNAILVKPDDPEDLARGIKMALENKNLAEKISARAYQEVQNYTWENRAKKILNLIYGK